MSENPLKQFFRRPAVYLTLPSKGVGYPEGAIDMPATGELPIYPMTAIDEITTRTPDALFNGTAVVEIIRSCVPNIKDPWSVLSIDLDPILVAIRTATNGSQMEIETVCPSCNEDAKYDVNLQGVLSSFKPGNYSEPLVIDDELSVKFKSLPFTEINKASLMQLEVQKALININNMEDGEQKTEENTKLLNKLNKVYMELIAKTIEHIKVPGATVFEPEYITEFLQNCSKNVYDTIRDHSIKLRESTQTKPLKLKCIHCQHEYQQPFSINVSDFFV